MPNGDGTYREILQKCLKLKDCAVPSILPRMPNYSSHSRIKSSRLTRESKDDEVLSEAMNLSLISNTEENKKFLINTFQVLQDKLPLSLLKKHGHTGIRIQVELYVCALTSILTIFLLMLARVEVDLSVKAYRKGENFQYLKYILVTRQLEMLL